MHLNKKIALEWFDSFNHHNLNQLLSLYDESAEHYSPKLKLHHPASQGLIKGKPALRAWWQDAFVRLPNLHYEVLFLTAEDDRIFMEYIRQTPGEDDLRVGEVLIIKGGKIISSRVYHS